MRPSSSPPSHLQLDLGRLVSQAKSLFSSSPSYPIATSPPANVRVGSCAVSSSSPDYCDAEYEKLHRRPFSLWSLDFRLLGEFEEVGDWLTFDVGKEAAAETTYRPYRGRSDFLLRSGYCLTSIVGLFRIWTPVPPSVLTFSTAQLESNVSRFASCTSLRAHATILHLSQGFS